MCVCVSAYIDLDRLQGGREGVLKSTACQPPHLLSEDRPDSNQHIPDTHTHTHTHTVSHMESVSKGTQTTASRLDACMCVCVVSPDAGAAYSGDGFSWLSDAGDQQLEQILQHQVDQVLIANI